MDDTKIAEYSIVLEYMENDPTPDTTTDIINMLIDEFDEPGEVIIPILMEHEVFVSPELDREEDEICIGCVIIAVLNNLKDLNSRVAELEDG